MSANQVVPGLASKATLFAILGGACIVALSILWGASVIGREIRCAGYLSSPGAADGVGVVAMRRALTKGIETATSPEDRVWFEADRRLREKLTIRDLGVWSHYPGDASQPLHVSVHYNGWGDYPNPQGFTPKKIHAYFEGEFVRSLFAFSSMEHSQAA